MVRIPYGRLELRLADGSANPYLVATAIIAAGLDGIDRQLPAPPPINENLYDFSEADLQKYGIATLPQNLGSALDALAQDQVLMSALGVLAQEFIDLKRMEYVEYQRHVSDWEIKRYLEFF
jgi:glutamine synthetase